MSASDTPSSITSFVSPVGWDNVIFPLFQNKQHNTCCNNIRCGKDLHVRKSHLWKQRLHAPKNDAMNCMFPWCTHNFSPPPPSLLPPDNSENMIWPNKSCLLTIFPTFYVKTCNIVICWKPFERLKVGNECDEGWEQSWVIQFDPSRWVCALAAAVWWTPFRLRNFRIPVLV